MTDDTGALAVLDVVGPTVLAQGMAAGRRCTLVRLGGCNLACSWCDTPFTWDASRYDLNATLGQHLATDVAEAALAVGTSLVVLTGGEPLLQQNRPGWGMLLERLGVVELGLETNGTLMPSEQTLRGLSWVTVSPKLAHAGDPSWERIRAEPLTRWAQLATALPVDFFFVVRDVTDIETIAQVAGVHGIPADRVWVSPEGVTPVAVMARLQEVATAAVAAGFNVAPRITNPFGGPSAARRTVAEFTAPALTSAEAQVVAKARPAPVGARFRTRG